MSSRDDKNSQAREYARRRTRDFIILTVGAISVLGLLFLTGAVGSAEWLTGSIVMLAGSLAFYVGSLPPPGTNIQLDTAPAPQKKSKKKSGRDVTSFILTLPFPALVIGTDNRIKTINQTARDLFDADEIAEPHVTSIIRDRDLLDATERVAATGAVELVEIGLRNDSETWLAHLRTGPDNGSVLIVLEELTAVRRAQLARADFLANASHELRTPLTAISGFIETMMGPAQNDKASWNGFLEIMHQQAERMKRLVTDLLSLSRIESEEHRSPSTRIDANALVERAGKSLQPIARKANVNLSFHVPDERLDLIADEDEMMQVIQNLASNAIKYTREGGDVRIMLGEARTMAEAAQLCGRQIDGAQRALLLAPLASAEAPGAYLRVSDNGEGIAPQHLPRLGERFYRTDESRGGEIEGTGLGLAIVKHIMARHRGGLAVESKFGEATAFGVWMPLATRRS